MAQVEGIRKPDIRYTKIFINNEWHNAGDLNSFLTYNPATGEEIAKVQEGREIDINRAVAAARAAVALGSPWRRMDASARGMLLAKFADLIEEDRLYLASLETCNNGKPFKDSYNIDLNIAVSYMRHFAGWPDKVMGRTIPIDGDFFCYTRYEPRGVVGAILPWNYPLALFCVKVGCALAAGNTMVIKPAEQTPLTALYLASLMKKAGIPPGVVNVVPGYGPTAGGALAEHMDVDMLTFTGSTEVGHFIQIASGKSNLKHLHMELGGKSPNIIFPDVDIDVAVEKAHMSVFHNMGQCCTAGSRTFVHEDIYLEFVTKSVEKAKNRKVGDPFDNETDSGSQIDQDQMTKILDLLASGKAQGARLECGGGRQGDKGFFIEPTIFSSVTDDMFIAKEEIFGPVMCILRFKTMEEVLQRANKTSYGLAGGVFTNDINKAMTVANGLQCGTVWINTYHDMRPNAPFGGYKMSGIGREQGLAGIEEFCQTKTVMMKIPEKNS